LRRIVVQHWLLSSNTARSRRSFYSTQQHSGLGHIPQVQKGSLSERKTCVSKIKLSNIARTLLFIPFVARSKDTSQQHLHMVFEKESLQKGSLSERKTCVSKIKLSNIARTLLFIPFVARSKDTSQQHLHMVFEKESLSIIFVRDMLFSNNTVLSQGRSLQSNNIWGLSSPQG
jgi:hypothetical protein